MTNEIKQHNLRVYEALREVPEIAQRKIAGGRLKGFTNIDPMWRIKALTEQFGPLGEGWYYDITDVSYQQGGAETVVTVMINLFYRVSDSEWSKPAVGVGGAKFVSVERNGNIFVDDEAVKKALTDAISVAGKGLGLAADVYFGKDANKYEDGNRMATAADRIRWLAGAADVDVDAILRYYEVQHLDDLTEEQAENALAICKKHLLRKTA